MAGSVRVDIEDDEVVSGTMENEVAFVPRGVLRKCAEDAGGRRVGGGSIAALLTAFAGNILIAPGRP
jgi:hypothetical protein